MSQCHIGGATFGDPFLLWWPHSGINHGLDILCVECLFTVRVSTDEEEVNPSLFLYVQTLYFGPAWSCRNLIKRFARLGVNPAILNKFYHYVKCGITYLYYKCPFTPLIWWPPSSMAILFVLAGLLAHQVKQRAGFLLSLVDKV